MTSFRFPPPPPPPPRASSSDSQQPYPSQRGGYSRGRGDGGRGRGGGSRGGAGSFGRSARGGQASGYSRGPPGGYQNNGEGPPQQRGGSSFAQGQWHHPTAMAQASMSSVPLVSSSPYVNPPFSTPSPVDPNTYVQAMSFMATQAGAQSMAAFASHMAGAANPSLTQPMSAQTAQHQPRYSPTPQSGQKRKWEERQSSGTTQSCHPLQRKQQHQGSKPPRARAAVAPAIPTFGFALPTPQAVQSSKPSTKGNRPKDSRKAKVRLGLTHEPAPDESSEEEDVDEELELGTKLKGGGFAFEHEGEHISLQTAGDIAEWIKDRRRNFPTYQKAMEKAEAAAIKRRNELDFVRKLKGKPLQPETSVKTEVQPKVYERSKRDEKKQEELAALRKKLHESMMKKKKKEAPATVDLGLGYGSVTESDEGKSSVLSESSVVSSSEESSEDSDSESEGSDVSPEPISSKLGPPPINVPTPLPMLAHTERRPGKEKICNSWRQHGKCSFGHSCKFKHPPKEATRTGLYEKLVEQELLKTDHLALDAIKFLGQNGFLG